MPDKKDFFALVIVFLIFCGIFFRDKKIIFAGFSLSFILLFDYHELNKKIDFAVLKFWYLRKPKKTIISRGSTVSVELEYEAFVPEKTSVQVIDINPKGSVLTQGNYKSPVLIKSKKGNLRYEILCRSHGKNIFPGFILKIKDGFFEREIKVSESDKKNTEISVFPKPSFIEGTFYPLSGKLTDKPAIFKSYFVKWIREYTQSDDLRRVDWKASAKFNKLFVREYTGIEKNIQTIIIDVPETEDFGAEEKLRFIKDTAGSVIKNQKKEKIISFILIAGPNLISVVRCKNNPEEILSLINSIKTVFSDKHLYGYSPKNEFDFAFKSDYSNSVREKSLFFLKMKKPHIFERQIFNALKDNVYGKEILLISVPKNDLSHLRIVCSAFDALNLKSYCFIPKGEDSGQFFRKIAGIGFDEVTFV